MFCGRMVKFNEALGAKELNVSLGQIDIDVIKLTEFLHLMLRATEANKNNLLMKVSQEWNK